jgi:hypothetical protein
MYDTAASVIKQAQRFALDREILIAATNVSTSMPSSIMQGLQLCRLPFPKTWFEYAGRDRPGESGDKAVPHRVGILAEAPADAPNHILMSVFWRHAKPMVQTVNVGPSAVILDLSAKADLAVPSFLTAQKLGASHEMIADLIRKRNDPADRKVLGKPSELQAALDLSNRVYFMPSPYFAHVGMEAMMRGNGVALREALESTQADSENEIMPLICTLMLLNSRNGVTKEPVDLTQLNRSRLRRGARPLLEHWTLRLKLSKTQQNGLSQSRKPATSSDGQAPPRIGDSNRAPFHTSAIQ